MLPCLKRGSFLYKDVPCVLDTGYFYITITDERKFL